MSKAVSDKSTKTEILDAYNELLAKLKEQKSLDAKAMKKEAEEKEVVKAALDNSVDHIVKRHADLKLEIVSSMDSLEEKLIREYKKLTELQQAIETQTKLLNELFQITAEAESLRALVLAQQEKEDTFDRQMEQKRDDFDAEMAQKRAQWKKDQDDYETAKKERDTQLKKERTREEEEYTYNLQLTRKKDTDDYEARKAALEKELVEKKASYERDLAERERVVASREKELEELRLKAESFPKELERAIKETEKAVTERLDFKHRHEKELTAKESEGETKLFQQTIDALEKKIEEQEEQVRQLTQRANEATLQVQTIAIKAIEGASSTPRIITERGKET